MKIAIKKDSNGKIYIDKTALKRLDEETLINPPYNCSIVDVDKEDCEASDFNEYLRFDINKYNLRKNKGILEKELQEIGTWFTEYDNQVKQYERCQRLGIEYDKDINELDNQAKVNQERIREIRSLLKD